VPSGQRVAGSNPARRAGQRHIALLSLIDGSPPGSQRERMAAAAALPPHGHRNRLTRCQRHVASVITARRPAYARRRLMPGQEGGHPDQDVLRVHGSCDSEPSPRPSADCSAIPRWRSGIYRACMLSGRAGGRDPAVCDGGVGAAAVHLDQQGRPDPHKAEGRQTPQQQAPAGIATGNLAITAR